MRLCNSKQILKSDKISNIFQTFWLLGKEIYRRTFYYMLIQSIRERRINRKFYKNISLITYNIFYSYYIMTMQINKTVK